MHLAIVSSSLKQVSKEKMLMHPFIMCDATCSLCFVENFVFRIIIFIILLFLLQYNLLQYTHLFCHRIVSPNARENAFNFIIFCCLPIIFRCCAQVKVVVGLKRLKRILKNHISNKQTSDLLLKQLFIMKCINKVYKER